jgi:hypothetical protein
MRWVGRVVRIEEWRGAYRVAVGRYEGKTHLEDLGVDGRIILKYSRNSLGVEWFDLARYTNKWRDTANAIRTLRIP